MFARYPSMPFLHGTSAQTWRSSFCWSIIRMLRVEVCPAQSPIFSAECSDEANLIKPSGVDTVERTCMEQRRAYSRNYVHARESGQRLEHPILYTGIDPVTRLLEEPSGREGILGVIHNGFLIAIVACDKMVLIEFVGISPRDGHAAKPYFVLPSFAKPMKCRPTRLISQNRVGTSNSK